jgi:hypothetical protein
MRITIPAAICVLKVIVPFRSEQILPSSPLHPNLAMDAMQYILHRYYLFAVCCLESDELQFLNTFFANTVVL